jgi:hypothetical protein
MVPNRVSRVIKEAKDSVAGWNLQYSNLNTFHTWVTHSLHKTEIGAKLEFEKIVKSFPEHYNWRIIKYK